MLASQNNRVLDRYRECGGLDATSRWVRSGRGFVEKSVMGGLVGKEWAMVVARQKRRIGEVRWWSVRDARRAYFGGAERVALGRAGRAVAKLIRNGGRRVCEVGVDGIESGQSVFAFPRESAANGGVVDDSLSNSTDPQNPQWQTCREAAKLTATVEESREDVLQGQ